MNLKDEIDNTVQRFRIHIQAAIAKESLDFYHTADTVNRELSNIDKEMTVALSALTRELLKGRLVELDLLEQAINQGRDMNKYKLMRLKSLEAELEGME